MNELFFEARGIAYRFNTSKREGNPVLVFIHGLSGSSSAWLDYEEVFAKTHTILSVDVRGHGLSKKHRNYEDYDIGLLAEDVALLLEALKIEKFVVVAHSFGTLIALELGLLRGKNVPMILLAPNFSIRSIFLRRVTQPLFSLLVRIFPFLPFSGRIRGRTDYTNFHHTHDWDVKRIVPDIWNTSLRAYAFCLTQIYRFKKDDAWKDMQAPILIIHGRNDRIVPIENSIRMSQSLPRARFVIVEDTNHILVLNNVAEVSGLIVDFTQSLHK